MEPFIDMLAGGGLVLFGFALGRWVPSRRHRTKKIEPICGCDHHLSFHDPATGTCHGKKHIGYNYDTSTHVYADCTCRRYTGPEPLPDLYAKEIASE